MPPKAKFSRDDIVSAALAVVEKNGRDALTARSLAERLGSSPRPIFTVFDSMEEVHMEVFKAANALYTNEYVKKGLAQASPFKGVGTAYISFAAEKPKLFALLFMREEKTVPELSAVLEKIENSYENILNSIEITYGLCREKAFKLYLHLWIYTHGIATLTATRVCSFTGQEISDMLTEVFIGMLKTVKGDKADD